MWSTLLTMLIVVVVAACVGMAFQLINNKMDRMEHSIKGLEEAFVDDVLDAVDDLVFPLSEEDRNIVHRRVIGE
jgi:uncharacterized membrane protein